MIRDGNNESKSNQAIGFLTVLDCPKDGLFGGYLALNFLGRPLEFHCTAPLKPNRAQQILYGATLEAFLYGEQIGHALLKKSSQTPRVVFVDRQAILAVRDLIDMPVALVESPCEECGEKVTPSATPDEPQTPASSGIRSWRVDRPHGVDKTLSSFHWGRHRLAISARIEDDRKTIADRLAGLPDSFDLAEPFTRIREAIEEARHGGA